MALQLGRAITDGIKRILTPTGAILLVAFLALQLLTQASINTAVISVFPPGPAGEIEAALGLTLPVSGTVAGALFAGSVVLSGAYFVVLSRALTRPAGALSTFPGDLFTRRMGRATLSMLVGGIVVSIAIMIGMALLVLPGIFLAASFVFFIFAVGVEDRGLVSALKRSWALARGNRIRLVVLVILAGAIGFVGSIVGTLFDIASAAIVGELLVNALNSVLFVFLYGIVAAAYLQVAADSPGVGKRGATDSLGSINR